MGEQFFRIATINFSHEYSGDLPLEGFSIAWDPDSCSIANNLQLLTKPIPGGFSIFSSDPELLHGEDSGLLIRIFIKNQFFYNFTYFGAEFRPDSKVFLFSDATASLGSNRLHPGEFVSVTDALEKFNPRTLNELVSRVERKMAFLRDFQHKEILAKDALRFLSDKEQTVFYVRDGIREQGYYKIPHQLESPPFGLISLNCNKMYQDYKDARGATSSYVRFQTRNTIWRYILADKVYEKFPQLMIVDSQSRSVNFRESEFEIQPAYKVRSFESEESLPMTVNSSSRFQLVETPKEGSQVMKVVIKQLPKASPEGLYPLGSQDEVFFSNIFI